MKKILAIIVISVIIPAQSYAASCTNITNNLGIGSRGPQVTLLQTFLIDAGVLSSSTTGYFGNLTFSALKIYQGIKQISQTGFVGPLTRQSIQKDSCQISFIQKPVACSMEARLCSDGSMMQRNEATCEWQINSCKETNKTNFLASSTPTPAPAPVTVSTSGIPAVYWDSKQAQPLSETMLNSLKSALKSAGFNINNFATTTMNETQILEMTRKFEQDYILNK